MVVSLNTWAEARYDMAQSILLLNTSGEFPESALIDAALYGVPCIGTKESAVQRELWPELLAEDAGVLERAIRIVAERFPAATFLPALILLMLLAAGGPRASRQNADLFEHPPSFEKVDIVAARTAD